MKIRKHAAGDYTVTTTDGRTFEVWIASGIGWKVNERGEDDRLTWCETCETLRDAKSYILETFENTGE